MSGVGGGMSEDDRLLELLKRRMEGNAELKAAVEKVVAESKD